MFLECKHIRYQYPKTDTYIFKDLNFHLSGPGFHALFGSSGVGKTTLAKLLSNEIHGFSGEIKTQEIHQVLYSYNMERLPGWYSIGDHLKDIASDSPQGRLDALVNSFGLRKCWTSRFSQLSLGQQNRTNLVRYLLQNFDLLIMDESLANVDERTREHIILKIKAMFPDKCFLYISHSVIEISKFCDHVFVIRGSHKHPQIFTIYGRNYMGAHALKNEDLERTMLEIVRVS